MNRTARPDIAASASGGARTASTCPVSVVPIGPVSTGFMPAATLDTLQSRFALQVAARLNQRCEGIDADVAERLRCAREKALERARTVRRTEAASPRLGVTASGSAMLGGRSGWWFKVASALPVLALVAGLLLIQLWQDSEQLTVAAEIDAALLADDLPPDAYSDEGFAEYLKTPPRE